MGENVKEKATAPYKNCRGNQKRTTTPCCEWRNEEANTNGKGTGKGGMVKGTVGGSCQGVRDGTVFSKKSAAETLCLKKRDFRKAGWRGAEGA